MKRDREMGSVRGGEGKRGASGNGESGPLQDHANFKNDRWDLRKPNFVLHARRRKSEA